jgi:hypothetical protein
VSGDYVYVADGASGLGVIDISDPTNPGTPIYGNATGVAKGVYVSGDYAYVANSDLGLAVIQVRRRIDMINPIISSTPGDIIVDYNYTNISISWMVTDTNPNIYTIALQGTGVVAGPNVWSNGVTITYNVPEGLAVGEYIYILNINDTYDNNIVDIVKITIIETINPLITHTPNDLILDYGYTGVNILWTATDPNPNIYTITLEGIGIVSGPNVWSNGVAITYNVPDGLTVGDYIYTVNFTDDFNNFITDVVNMTVRNKEMNLVIIMSIISVIGVGIAILVLRKIIINKTSIS